MPRPSPFHPLPSPGGEMSKPKFTKRERWMQQFESSVLAAMPGHRIEWESAVYFFNTGASAAESAAKYVDVRKGEPYRKQGDT